MSQSDTCTPVVLVISSFLPLSPQSCCVRATLQLIFRPSFPVRLRMLYSERAMKNHEQQPPSATIRLPTVEAEPAASGAKSGGVAARSPLVPSPTLLHRTRQQGIVRPSISPFFMSSIGKRRERGGGRRRNAGFYLAVLV